MSWQNPTFSRGLGGAANRLVANQWSQGAATATANADVLRWGRSEMAAGQVISMGLCQVTTAALHAPNRWIYAVSIWFPPPLGGGGISPPTDQTFSYNAQNLREFHNTAATVDGMDITNPPVIVGPVGSVWDGTQFPLTNLEAKVNVWVVYALDGTAWAYFDRPNPIVCEPLEGGEG
jgi:hypothetical protein